MGKSSSELPKIIVIAGPTASGKTALAIEIAKRFNGEVISADSRMVYRRMDIGTAKPAGEKAPDAVSWKLGQGVPLMVDGVVHWGIDLVNPDEDFSVAEFKRYADERIADILSRGRLPILAGGTGLWIKAVIDNLDIPEVPPNEALRTALEARSPGDLFAEYKRLDPEGAEVIDRHNKRRLVRALEVTKTTGQPFSALQKKGEPKYDALQAGPEVPREELNRRIDDRVDEMIGRGLVNEVRALREAYGCDMYAMSGIGYRQVCAFLEGQRSLADAIEDIKRDTRAYAKRQMTWFKRDTRIKWVSTPAEAVSIVDNFLK